MQSGMTGQAVYGGPRVVSPVAPVTASPTGGEANLTDPHDKTDKGPSDWFEDPVVWLVLLAGLATGILGFRFKWWGSGAEASARVNLGDEAGALIGTTLYAITGIVLFKIGASKIEVPGLQKLAAAI
jgi:hypothetical protein